MSLILYSYLKSNFACFEFTKILIKNLKNAIFRINVDIYSIFSLVSNLNIFEQNQNYPKWGFTLKFE